MGNGTPDYKLGQLDQAVKDIIDRLDGLENKVDSKFDDVLNKINTVNMFKWKMVGGITIMAFMINIALFVIINHFK